jgi:uncharacterized protein (DUF1330 family)
VDKDSVYLVTELWIFPDSFPQLKLYRKIVNDILEKYNPEYIFHNHAFEWVYGGECESYPTGIEIVKFESEKIARSAIAALDTTELKKMENEVFDRVRCYLSRHAFPDNLMKEIYNRVTGGL